MLFSTLPSWMAFFGRMETQSVLPARRRVVMFASYCLMQHCSSCLRVGATRCKVLPVSSASHRFSGLELSKKTTHESSILGTVLIFCHTSVSWMASDGRSVCCFSAAFVSECLSDFCTFTRRFASSCRVGSSRRDVPHDARQRCRHFKRGRHPFKSFNCQRCGSKIPS